MKKLSSYQLLFACICFVIAGCVPQALQPELPEPQIEPTETTAPTKIILIAEVPEGWKSFTDEALGLSFSYPDPYTVLTDEENLYGWENGIALLYDGGQSYDIVVQVWGSAEEMESNFGSRMVDVIVFEKGNEFISVFDITMEENNAAIIETFQVAD